MSIEVSLRGMLSPGRYFTQMPHCWFSRWTAHLSQCFQMSATEATTCVSMSEWIKTSRLNASERNRPSPVLFKSSYTCVDNTLDRQCSGLWFKSRSCLWELLWCFKVSPTSLKVKVFFNDLGYRTRNPLYLTLVS